MNYTPSPSPRPQKTSTSTSLTRILVAVTARLVLGHGGTGRTARHTLVVEAVQVQRVRARHARVLAGAAARAARLVARPALQRRPIVKLAAQALHAEAALEHKVGGTRGAGERTGICGARRRREN